MRYTILFVVFSSIMAGYLLFAKKQGIVDKPNQRSSHNKPTVRGGGVIFTLAVLVWALLFDHADWLFVSALILMGIIGFLDDLYSLLQLPRMIIQLLGVLLLLLELGLLAQNLFFTGIAFILITGWLNTFNFMDGINGILVLYSGSVLTGVYLFRDAISHIELSLIYVVGLTLVVFGWLNVRKNALVFAGDAGSLSMGLILAYFVSNLIISTGRWEFIIFFSVYGVDSVLTIIHRLIGRENIFKAHRSHLYQYLVNELEWPHLSVAFIYSLLQLMVILGLYIFNLESWTIYSVSILFMITVIYILSKVLILKRVQKINL